MQQLFLPWSQHQLVGRFHLQGLNAQPCPFQGLFQPLGTVFQPGCQVVPAITNLLQFCVIPRPIFPVVFIHGKDVVRVETAAVEFP